MQDIKNIKKKKYSEMGIVKMGNDEKYITKYEQLCN